MLPEPIKHTGHPWKLNEKYREIISTVEYVSSPFPEYDDPGINVTVIHLGGNMGGDHSINDARLMNAAPEMYHLIRRAIEASDNPGTDYDWIGEAERILEEIEQPGKSSSNS
jgi:hypothetical protein